MNYARLVAAAVAGTLVDAIYGVLVYGTALRGEFSRYPDVYRSAAAGAAYLPLMFLAIFLAMIMVTMIYAKGYEGKGSGAAEGMRFGALVGPFVALFFAGVSYGTLNIGRKLAAYLICAGIVEWILVGAAIGAVYRSSTARRSARAAF
ncbi:MAG TPA: hypothetical protein VGL62_09915 [Vicinamibacterales bacterium]